MTGIPRSVTRNSKEFPLTPVGVRFAGLCVILMAAGCGGGNPNPPKLMPVSGTVTLDGRPLSGVMVSFVPTGSTHGSGARGHTDNAGRYELTATHGGKGTPVGDYRVVARKLVMPDGSNFPANSNVAPFNSPARQVLPAKYSERDRTVLAALVRDGANTIDFPLASKP